MRSLFVTAIYASFFWYGFRVPIILVLGYVWVDIFMPQYVVYSLLNSVPVSMLLGVAIFIAVPFLPKNNSVRIRSVTVLTAMFAVWMTLTLLWSAVPDSAYFKWNWAVKGIVVSCVVPFFLRSRLDIEAFVWTIVISGIANCVPYAIKTLISGGGYGFSRGLQSVEFGFNESSSISMYAACLVPMCLYLIKNNTIMPMNRLLKYILSGFIIMAIICSVGTFARTGFVCIVVLASCLLFQTKKKISYIVISTIFAIVVLPILGDAWEARMATITDGVESSAMGRVAVWLWALEYVSNNLLGGGFDVYRINEFEMILSNGLPMQIRAKAFHNIYMEVLTELGVPGLVIYFSIITATLYNFWSFGRVKIVSELWLSDLGGYLFIVSIVFLAGGCFVGVGFQSFFYYLVAISAGMLNVQSLLNSKSTSGWIGVGN